MPSVYSQGKGKPARRQEALERPIAAGLHLDPQHVNVIDESHQRCAALGLTRIERPDLGLLARADLAVARERNRRLHAHAAPVMELLYDQIVNTESMVVLTDAIGTVLHSIGDDDFLDRAAKVALKPGAVWSEASKGTNAVGTALMEEKPTLVHADEHFFHANHFLTCSAAPILDPRGNILGVLDVSGDHRSYHQHTMALVKMSARMIENHWLSDDYRNVMRLHFHHRVEFIGTLMEGILAVKPDGRIVGANRGALEQLGMSGATLRMQTLESLFGTSVGALVDRFRTPLAAPLPVHCSNGRGVFLHARFDWPVWTSLAEAVAAQVPGAANAPALPAGVCELHPRDALGAAAVAPRAPAASAPLEAARVAPAAALDAQVTQLIERIRRALEHGIPVVIHGETGSGKEWLARAAHAAARPAHAFHFVACATLPASEVDASFGNPALLGGPGDATLFLDQVGELAPAAQTQLLQLLDQLRPRAAGTQPAVAVVCASRTPLRMRVDDGRFREDLYYRLNGLGVRVPPLRERSDLDALVDAVLAREGHATKPRLAPEVHDLLRRHRWPGNVRQLGNVLRAAVVLSGGAACIETRHLPEDFIEELGAAGPEDAAHATGRPANGAPQSLEAMEREMIRQAVADAHGNISEASKRLGISRNTIYRKLRWNERH